MCFLGYKSGFTLKKEWTTVKVMEQPAEYNTYMGKCGETIVVSIHNDNGT